LDRAQSKEDFLKALDDYEAIVKAGRARAEARLTGGAAPAPAATHRFNPATGKIEAIQ
jgi:hypothetical protein